MMALGDELQKILFKSLFIYLSLATIIGSTQGQSIQVTPCAANTLPPTNLSLAVNVTGTHCFLVPIQLSSSVTTHTLWYERDFNDSSGATTLSVVLQVAKQTPAVWYGMGFNPEKSVMAGTSAIIFYLNETTAEPIISTDSLSGDGIQYVKPDNTALTYKSQPQVVPNGNFLYLAFDVEDANSTKFNYENFAVGASGDVPPQGPEHQGVSSFQIDFATNTLTLTSNDINTKARNHGILNIIGWGVLLPGGAITARYFRSFDPHWFYVHAVLQILGYVFVVLGFGTGLELYDDVHKQDPNLNVDAHRTLAIFIFVSATVQMTAILLRPKKDAKLRRYWNWHHWWVGRITLLVAVVNIFVGIHLGKAGRSWKVGYGTVLGIELLLIVVLEALLWIKFARAKNESAFPQTAMQNRGPANGPTTMSPPSNYGSVNWDAQ